jgi:hypothetical protein
MVADGFNRWYKTALYHVPTVETVGYDANRPEGTVCHYQKSPIGTAHMVADGFNRWYFFISHINFFVFLQKIQ